MNPSDQNHTARDPLGHDPSESEYSQEWLSAYIDDELTDVQRATVEQRIAADSDTRRLLSELQHMRGLIGQLPTWSGGPIDHARVTEAAPGSELSLHSESFAETLEQACRSHDEASQSNQETLASRVDAAGDAARRDVSWWRPVALAACLALLTGGGIWWWQSEASTTLATSARVTEPPEKSASTPALDAPMLESAPDALGSDAMPFDAMKGEANRDMANPRADETIGGVASQSDNAMHGAMLGKATAEAAPALGEARATSAADNSTDNFAGNSGEAIVANSPSAARLQFPPPAPGASQSPASQDPSLSHPQLPPLPSPAMRSEGSSDVRSYGLNNALTKDSSEERGLAKSSLGDAGAANEPQQLRMSEGQRSPTVQIQLAHSAGWSADDISRALQRLAPLLNIPSVPSDEPRENGSSDKRGDDTEQVADIPIALIMQRRAVEQATPLMDVLSQQSVALQQIAPSDAQNYAWHMPMEPAPASKDTPPETSTIALFVLREEAEQILQAARQSGEMLANPVWITSASGSSTPVGPKQQVVLLFTPQ